MTDWVQREFSGEIRRTRSKTISNTRRQNYVGMQGRVTLAEVRAFLDEHAPHVAEEEVGFNWLTLVWEDDATAEEIAQQEEKRKRAAAGKEQYERKMLTQYLNTYGIPENYKENQ